MARLLTFFITTVAITYLHPTHLDVPYYMDEAWAFTRGALGTIDRSMGFIGRHFFHEIIDFHLVHHLFPKIPFYHAEAPTKAIRPLLGSQYVDAKGESFLRSLYTTFKSCNFVAEKRDAQNSRGDGRLLWVTKRDITLRTAFYGSLIESCQNMVEG